MPLSHDGHIQLFRVTDADGNPAQVSLVAGVYRLAVDAVISGGGGGGPTEDEDNSVPAGLTLPVQLGIPYVFNGTTWIRQQGGVDNAVAPSPPQGLFAGGVVTDPPASFANGDVSLLHFDTQGRLLVSAAASVSNAQVQNVETTAALGGFGSFTSPARDMINHEGFGISVYAQGSVMGPTAAFAITVENSHDGTTFRPVERMEISLFNHPDELFVNKKYAVCRRYYRVVLQNLAPSALSATELVTIQSPIA